MKTYTRTRRILQLSTSLFLFRKESCKSFQLSFPMLKCSKLITTAHKLSLCRRSERPTTVFTFLILLYLLDHLRESGCETVSTGLVNVGQFDSHTEYIDDSGKCLTMFTCFVVFFVYLFFCCTKISLAAQCLYQPALTFTTWFREKGISESTKRINCLVGVCGYCNAFLSYTISDIKQL